MNNRFFQKAALVSILAGISLAIGCGGGAEGKCADPSNQIIAEFKDSKAYIALGGNAVTGAHKIEGNKIIARSDFGLMIPNPSSSPSMTTAQSWGQGHVYPQA